MIRGSGAGRLATAAYLACAGVAIGSFGPWAVGPFGYSGINTIGSLALLMALAAAVAVWCWTATASRSAVIATALFGTICVCIGVYGAVEILTDPAFASTWTWDEGVGWGLVLVLGAGGVLVLLATSMYRRSRVDGRENVSRLQALLAGAGLLFLIGLLIVASGDPRRPAEGDLLFLDGPSGQVGGRSAEQEILAFRPGASVEYVMARLGPPASVVVSKDQPGVLSYGRWQLQFGDRGLTRRVKYVRPEVELDLQAYDRRWRRLEREIRGLQTGASIEAVKAKLGPPEGIEVLDSSLQRDVGLLYGEWRLDFADKRLEGRYR